MIKEDKNNIYSCDLSSIFAYLEVEQNSNLQIIKEEEEESRKAEIVF